jgi:hypothetical protein
MSALERPREAESRWIWLWLDPAHLGLDGQIRGIVQILTG